MPVQWTEKCLLLGIPQLEESLHILLETHMAMTTHSFVLSGLHHTRASHMSQSSRQVYKDYP